MTPHYCDEYSKAILIVFKYSNPTRTNLYSLSSSHINLMISTIPFSHQFQLKMNWKLYLDFLYYLSWVCIYRLMSESVCWSRSSTVLFCTLLGLNSIVRGVSEDASLCSRGQHLTDHPWEKMRLLPETSSLSNSLRWRWQPLSLEPPPSSPFSVKSFFCVFLKNKQQAGL